MLWPRINVAQSGYNLAVSGAVGKNAYDEPEVALEFLHYAAKPYAALLKARFKLVQSVDEVAAMTDEQLLEAIAGKVQAVGKGGHVDWHKAAERVITDFRTGALGRITLELPEEFAEWQALAVEADEARDAKKAARKPPKKRTGKRDRRDKQAAYAAATAQTGGSTAPSPASDD
jgi:ribosome biogenesis GTPase A